MLFHVALVHSADHCPGYHRELMPPTVQALEQREEIARRHNVKIHALLNAAPEHRFFAVLEAERPMDVAGFIIEAAPFPQDEITVTAVQTAEEMLAMAKEMMAQAQR